MNLQSKLLYRAAAPALILVALVAAGCGGSSSASSGSATTTSQDAARIKYTQCLRDNGVNVPDNPGQGGPGGRFGNVDQATLQKAQAACRKYQQAVVANITPAQRQAFQDAFAKFSSCMRQHGVNLPARTPGQGPPAGGAQINRNDPKVQAAQKACQSKLPQGGPGGGRFGGGGGGNN
jgi:hypothetical protein